MPPPTLRKRNMSTSLSKGDITIDGTLEKDGFSDDEEQLNSILHSGFSDDEESYANQHDPKESTSSAPIDHDAGETDSNMVATDVMDDVINQAQFTAEAEEVEDDLEMFNNAIHISNLEQVDHACLLRRMHARFKKKVMKWEAMAYMYSRYSFAMNFAILAVQVMLMILQQAANMWVSEKQIMPGTQESKNLFQKLGIYKMSEWKGGAREAPRAYGGEFISIANSQYLQGIQSILTAITALIAGLQLKLKLNEKAERYRRGAKVYGRLLRISTYYIMMLESGGKIEDVTGLWREAMKKEGKWIPLVRTFMPL